MDPDGTWHGGRPQPRGLCVRWGTSPSLKGGGAPAIFCPCLLWSNGCIDQDATWYGGRPRPRRQCVRWGPSSPFESREPLPQIFGPCLLWPNGHRAPMFSAHVYCGHGRPSQLLLSSCFVYIFVYLSVLHHAYRPHFLLDFNA